jgi:hypothetical protein
MFMSVTISILTIVTVTCTCNYAPRLKKISCAWPQIRWIVNIKCALILPKIIAHYNINIKLANDTIPY